MKLLKSITLWVRNVSVSRYDKRGPIFVTGTGRSGTHFMDSVLCAQEEITDLNEGKENPFVFQDVTVAALREKRLAWSAALKYRALAGKAYPKILVDQSHPNLWHVEELLKWFPNAKFLCMVRCPFSVAYSTLKHPGVRSRLLTWSKFPTPNRFLGIDNENREDYPHWSLARRSVARWSSHMRRIDYLAREYPSSVHVVMYESLCDNTKSELERIQKFLGLKARIPLPEVKTNSLTKKNHLDPADMKDVYNGVSNSFSVKPLVDERYIPISRYLEQASPKLL